MINYWFLGPGLLAVAASLPFYRYFYFPLVTRYTASPRPSARRSAGKPTGWYLPWMFPVLFFAGVLLAAEGTLGTFMSALERDRAAQMRCIEQSLGYGDGSALAANERLRYMEQRLGIHWPAARRRGATYVTTEDRILRIKGAGLLPLGACSEAGSMASSSAGSAPPSLAANDETIGHTPVSAGLILAGALIIGLCATFAFLHHRRTGRIPDMLAMIVGLVGASLTAFGISMPSVARDNAALNTKLDCIENHMETSSATEDDAYRRLDYIEGHLGLFPRRARSPRETEPRLLRVKAALRLPVNSCVETAPKP